MTVPPRQRILSLHMQLLAILHDIVFPGQRLADLPDRIERSRQTLAARAKTWVDLARKNTQVRRLTRTPR